MIRCSGSAVTLPRLGVIRTHESTRKLTRRLENGTARILSATVSHTAQRWFASFTVVVERNVPPRHSRPSAAIGVDLGVRTLLTGVDDQGNVVTVAGLIRNRALARAISDQGFGTARRLLEYKTTWQGGRLILASRWFPSSKLCSGCGAVKAKLALSERTYRCESCDLIEDRDVNAARNLLQLAASGAERVNDCGGTVRPDSAGRVPRKQ